MAGASLGQAKPNVPDPPAGRMVVKHGCGETLETGGDTHTHTRTHTHNVGKEKKLPEAGIERRALEAAVLTTGPLARGVGVLGH